jgi:hypothetical protein
MNIVLLCYCYYHGDYSAEPCNSCPIQSQLPIIFFSILMTVFYSVSTFKVIEQTELLLYQMLT